MTLYKKVGRKYVPVSEFSEESYNSFPHGVYVRVSMPYSVHTVRISEKEFDPMAVATVMRMSDAIVRKMQEIDTPRPATEHTPKQIEAFRAYVATLPKKDRCRVCVMSPSLPEIVECALKQLLKDSK